MNLIFKKSPEQLAREETYKKLLSYRDILRKELTEIIEEIQKINPLFFSALLRQSEDSDSASETGSSQSFDSNNNGAKLPSKSAEKLRNKQKYAKEQKLKDMWRRIAAQCHPDKTTDTDKHEIYTLAVKAKDDLDEYALTQLYVQLTEGQIDNERQELLARLIERLAAEVSHLESNQLQNLIKLRRTDQKTFINYIKIARAS